LQWKLGIAGVLVLSLLLGGDLARIFIAAPVGIGLILGAAALHERIVEVDPYEGSSTFQTASMAVMIAAALALSYWFADVISGKGLYYRASEYRQFEGTTAVRRTDPGNSPSPQALSPASSSPATLAPSGSLVGTWERLETGRATRGATLTIGDYTERAFTFSLSAHFSPRANADAPAVGFIEGVATRLNADEYTF
jgi:hypothetical protein